MATRDYSLEKMRSPKSDEKFKTVKKSCVLYEGDAEAVRKKFVPSDVRYYVIQAIFIGVIIAALVALSIYLKDTGEAQARYDDVIEEYTLPEPIPAREMDPDTAAWPPIVDFDHLKSLNPDICGWIRIPGTDVDYPVLVSDQRDYYLNHNMYGNYDASGAIFADYQNSKDLNADPHLVIYGHHMNVSTMFHAVSQYRDPAFLEAHRVIYFETPEWTYVMKPIGTYIADEDEYPVRQVIFANGNEFQGYSDTRFTRPNIAVHDDFDRRVNDKLMTLVTCTNTGKDRIIVECVVEQRYPTSLVPNVIARALADNGITLNENGKVVVEGGAEVPEGVIDPERQ